MYLVLHGLNFAISVHLVLLYIRSLHYRIHYSKTLRYATLILNIQYVSEFDTQAQSDDNRHQVDEELL